MLQGYISGTPIHELPPTKNVGNLQYDENIDMNKLHLANDEPSPIKKSRIDLDSSDETSFIDKDRLDDTKWNNSLNLNKSLNNVSRYSINIEAQSDLNQITILLNDKDKKKNDDFNRINLDDSNIDEMMEIDDDDMLSDKDKSMYFESSSKHINFKHLPDIRKSISQYVDRPIYDVQIEGNRPIPG
mmetsp:Transcript_2226/g.2592  ORF Transcript_2226/g.2592 Transcript_2226/m.2592 type:complete len:186 (+) Transcript_2226:328-885(+)|eukprot:CAMPEP_0205805742 /NCGR_PEP_ID=MMETSP0205-20121125/9067_1 /ASSEMBLY_ACC=CAM_ASM_000278 /TAXON_ID=36767 /ORGANISM="Euplotes focardii, Strain TN1" /LENGTH=185 /DNA_ID=CAMNT_0053077467 /DNA_START=331 /DNA_END=888 /DNA_ORIENTATION=+